MLVAFFFIRQGHTDIEKEWKTLQRSWDVLQILLLAKYLYLLLKKKKEINKKSGGT